MSNSSREIKPYSAMPHIADRLAAKKSSNGDNDLETVKFGNDSNTYSSNAGISLKFEQLYKENIINKGISHKDIDKEYQRLLEQLDAEKAALEPQTSGKPKTDAPPEQTVPPKTQVSASEKAVSAAQHRIELNLASNPITLPEQPALPSDAPVFGADIKPDISSGWAQILEQYDIEPLKSAPIVSADILQIKDEYNLPETAETTGIKHLEVYNPKAGAKIANAAKHPIGGISYCLKGVRITLGRVYGRKEADALFVGSACNADDVLALNTGIGSHFQEVKLNRSDLNNLPPGAIVVWDKGAGKGITKAGAENGHISIATCAGKESSDHIQKQIVNRPVPFRVFYPIS